MNTKALSLTLILAAALTAPAALAGHGKKAKNYRGYTAAYSYSTGGYAYRPVRVSRAAPSDYDWARVVEVEPILRYVTVRVPTRECWDEEVYRSNGHRGDGVAGATIAGGLIGGVIGRQIGGGSGRDAMTVVGTLVGSALANESARNRSGDRDRYENGYYDTVRRCETRNQVREEERLDGYRVTYLYHGREYTTRTDSDPGERIRVRVSISPTGRR